MILHTASRMESLCSYILVPGWSLCSYILLLGWSLCSYLLVLGLFLPLALCLPSKPTFTHYSPGTSTAIGHQHSIK